MQLGRQEEGVLPGPHRLDIGECCHAPIGTGGPLSVPVRRPAIWDAIGSGPPSRVMMCMPTGARRGLRRPSISNRRDGSLPSGTDAAAN
jgi:hypothetical protein